jgi:hypothetical protein
VGLPTEEVSVTRAVELVGWKAILTPGPTNTAERARPSQPAFASPIRSKSRTHTITSPSGAT